jgi:hypothetical protein
VTVGDTTPPEFDITPDDIEAEEGDSISLTWGVFDLCPESYDVLLNGSSISSGDWNITSAEITVSVDGLPAGIYNVTILIEDCSGNTARDEVIITITEPTPTTTTTTTTTTSTTNITTTTTPTEGLDPGTALTLTVAGAGGVVAIVVVVYIISKKKSG